jgi:hypothetical protein
MVDEPDCAARGNTTERSFLDANVGRIQSTTTTSRPTPKDKVTKKFGIDEWNDQAPEKEQYKNKKDAVAVVGDLQLCQQSIGTQVGLHATLGQSFACSARRVGEEQRPAGRPSLGRSRALALHSSGSKRRRLASRQ